MVLMNNDKLPHFTFLEISIYGLQHALRMQIPSVVSSNTSEYMQVMILESLLWWEYDTRAAEINK